MRRHATRAVSSVAFAMFAFVVGARALVSPFTGIALASLPTLALALCFPQHFLTVAVAVLPFSVDLTGGRLGGAQVAVSDVLLALGSLGVMGRVLTSMPVLAWLHPLRPMLVPVSVYVCALVLTVIAAPSVQAAFTLVQRLELVAVALLAGLFLAHRWALRRALTLFVCSASLLAMAATLTVLVQGTDTGGFLGVQKNPAGQAIAGAFLVVVAAPRVPARPVVAALLAVGLLASLSRGAILAAAVGLFVIALLHAPGRRLRLTGLAAALCGLVALAFNALPPEQQERLVEVSPETDYAAGERVRYAEDARAVFESAPFLGVGPGNYAGGDLAPGIADPHNVLLLEAAEGGIVLAGAFILLTVSSLVVLARRRRRHPLVVTALAVQLATVLHGMVDVYWVRGTPVLGWVLVGAALALAHREDPLPSRSRHQEVGTPWR